MATLEVSIGGACPVAIGSTNPNSSVNEQHSTDCRCSSRVSINDKFTYPACNNNIPTQYAGLLGACSRFLLIPHGVVSNEQIDIGRCIKTLANILCIKECSRPRRSSSLPYPFRQMGKLRVTPTFLSWLCSGPDLWQGRLGTWPGVPTETGPHQMERRYPPSPPPPPHPP